MNKTIKIEGIALASRPSASKVRTQVLSYLVEVGSVEVDLRSASSVSDSYADELFGILALQLGIEEFKKRVHVVTKSEGVLRTVAENIYKRTMVDSAA